jgi:hypothetical protein
MNHQKLYLLIRCLLYRDNLSKSIIKDQFSFFYQREKNETETIQLNRIYQKQQLKSLSESV